MKKHTFNLKKVLAVSALLIAGYAHAQLATVTTGTTHCTTTADDCSTGAYVKTTFTITVGDLVQFTNGDFRVKHDFYQGDWTSQGLAGHIVTNEILYSTVTSPSVAVADITTFNFTTLSFFSTAPVFLMNRNGVYRAKTYLQQKISGVWTDVFTTPLSPIYGANDQPPFNTWGDMGEVAFVENMKIGTYFKYSVNGLYQAPPAPLTIAACAASPLTIKNITGVMGNPGSATLTIEKGTLSGNVFTSLTSTTTTFGAENNNDINLTTSPFSLGSYAGALRITYRLPDDECYGVINPVVKTMTLSVVTAAFLNDYKARMSGTTGTVTCVAGDNKAISTTWNITATMPSNTDVNQFKCQLKTAIGWAGATSVGIKNVTFSGLYTVDVYEVNTSTGVRLPGAPSIYLNSGVIPVGQESLVDLPFNDPAYGAEFDASATNSVSTVYTANANGQALGNGNFFRDYYIWAKANTGLATYSAKVFCVEVSQYPAGGCVVNKKSFFKIANNGYGATAGGQNARMLTPEEETGEELQYASLEVFPNPTTDVVNIPLQADDKNVQVTITDNLGKQVMKTNNLESNHGELNMEALPAGIYFYDIIKNNTSYKGKIVKH
jgi:hypothetical protein